MFNYQKNATLWQQHCSRRHRSHHQIKSSRYNKKWRFRRSRKTCRLCGRSWIDCDPRSNYVSMALFNETLPLMRDTWFGPSILLEVLGLRRARVDGSGS